MKDKLNTSALFYLLEHLYKGTDLLVKATSDCGAPFGFVRDIDLASRCLFDALNFVRSEMNNEMKDVHQSD